MTFFPFSTPLGLQLGISALRYLAELYIETQTLQSYFTTASQTLNEVHGRFAEQKLKSTGDPCLDQSVMVVEEGIKLQMNAFESSSPSDIIYILTILPFIKFLTSQPSGVHMELCNENHNNS